MLGAESGLKLFKEVIIVEVGFDLRGDYTFQYF